MLSAAERVILGMAISKGFVSGHDLTPMQIKTARALVDRDLLGSAGTESDGTKVYRASAAGEKMFGEWS